MTGGQDSFRMEKRYIRKDGRVVWVDMSTASARGSNGEPLYIVTHAQDITDRKEAEEKLRRSESLYRRMALRLEQVREEERAALARELHDEMGQLLAGLRIDLSWLRKRLPKENKELIEKADAMQEYLLPLIKKVRRLYTELRPALLDEVGLIAAIEAHLHDFHQRTGIIARLETHLRHTSLGNPGENQKARRRV
jgi:signal transduction histidine kinase